MAVHMGQVVHLTVLQHGQIGPHLELLLQPEQLRQGLPPQFTVIQRNAGQGDDPLPQLVAAGILIFFHVAVSRHRVHQPGYIALGHSNAPGDVCDTQHRRFRGKTVQNIKCLAKAQSEAVFVLDGLGIRGNGVCQHLIFTTILIQFSAHSSGMAGRCPSDGK